MNPVVLLSIPALLFMSCASGERSTSAPLSLGEWGGNHMRLVVNPLGASTEFDCAHGSIDAPIMVSAEGRFEAEGRHVIEHGGAVNENEPDNAHPARYVGVVHGTTMTISITLPDMQRDVGTFELVHGTAATLQKCL